MEIDTLEHATQLIVISEKQLNNLVDEISENVVKKMNNLERNSIIQLEDEIISKKEACQILGRCDSTLSKWMAKNKLTVIRRGSSVYFRKKDILDIYYGRK